jgi:hypothetical protein
MPYCKYCKHFQGARVIGVKKIGDKNFFTKKCIPENIDVESDSYRCEDNFEPHSIFYCLRWNYRLDMKACMHRQWIVDFKEPLHSAFDLCKKCIQREEIQSISDEFNIYQPKLRRLKKNRSSVMKQNGNSSVIKLRRIDSSLINNKPVKLKRLSRSKIKRKK